MGGAQSKSKLPNRPAWLFLVGKEGPNMGKAGARIINIVSTGAPGKSNGRGKKKKLGGR